VLAPSTAENKNQKTNKETLTILYNIYETSYILRLLKEQYGYATLQVVKEI
jgi:hypothetical protein